MFQRDRPKEKRKSSQKKETGLEEVAKFGRWTYIIDLPSILLIILSMWYLSIVIVIFNQSESEQLQDLAFKGIIASILLLFGLIVAELFENRVIRQRKISIKFETFPRTSIIKGKRVNVFQQTLTWILIGMGLISLFNWIFVNFWTIQRFDITATDIIFFSVAMAIVEEVIFTFLFQITFSILLGSEIAGIIARGIFFMIYHLAVYSEQVNILITTLISGIVLAVVLWRTRRILNNILIHTIINIIAGIQTVGLTFAVA